MSGPFDHDSCLSFFGAVYAAGAIAFPLHARVLEIGCAEADWIGPMLEIRPDLEITGIDVRKCHRRGEIVIGDVLTHEWPVETFDAVVGVSSLEHIGLGHYGDPVDIDGDRHCMERVARWLRPGGVFYADVPYGADYAVVGTSHRVYDDQALRDRLLVCGLMETGRWYGADYTRTLSPVPPETDRGLVYVALAARKES